jgi:hypothetical protein
MDSKALRNATIVGTVLQLAMVVSGRFVPFIALHVFMFGGMGISALAGLLYGRGVSGLGGAAIGGVVAGGVCAVIGIAVSVVLGDTPAIILVFGTISSCVTGAIGGAIGQLLSGARATA